MFNQNKDEIRDVYQQAWDKFKKNQTSKTTKENQVTPLEQQIIDVFNKKALYIYIHEMIPEVKTPKITKIAKNKSRNSIH